MCRIQFLRPEKNFPDDAQRKAYGWLKSRWECMDAKISLHFSPSDKKPENEFPRHEINISQYNRKCHVLNCFREMTLIMSELTKLQLEAILLYLSRRQSQVTKRKEHNQMHEPKLNLHAKKRREKFASFRKFKFSNSLHCWRIKRWKHRAHAVWNVQDSGFY